MTKRAPQPGAGLGRLAWWAMVCLLLLAGCGVESRQPFCLESDAIYPPADLIGEFNWVAAQEKVRGSCRVYRRAGKRISFSSANGSAEGYFFQVSRDMYFNEIVGKNSHRILRIERRTEGDAKYVHIAYLEPSSVVRAIDAGFLSVRKANTEDSTAFDGSPEDWRKALLFFQRSQYGTWSDYAILFDGSNPPVAVVEQWNQRRLEQARGMTHEVLLVLAALGVGIMLAIYGGLALLGALLAWNIRSGVAFAWKSFLVFLCLQPLVALVTYGWWAFDLYHIRSGSNIFAFLSASFVLTQLMSVTWALWRVRKKSEKPIAATGDDQAADSAKTGHEKTGTDQTETASVECLFCKKDGLSPQAAMCPRCGHPLQSSQAE